MCMIEPGNCFSLSAKLVSKQTMGTMQMVMNPPFVFSLEGASLLSRLFSFYIF